MQESNGQSPTRSDDSLVVRLFVANLINFYFVVSIEPIPAMLRGGGGVKQVKDYGNTLKALRNEEWEFQEVSCVICKTH